MTENALIVQRGAALMPALELGQAVTRYNYLKELVKTVMVEGLHYGTVPGTPKPTLYKPGAEMLTTVFGLTPRFVVVKEIEQWNDGEEPFFYYWMRCQLYHGDALVGEGDGSCNSREGRYRWRWVAEEDVPPDLNVSALKKRGGKISEFTFAVDKAETTGKYGKPPEYWQQFRDAIDAGTAKKIKRATSKGAQWDAWEIDSVSYRVPNEDIYTQVNTVLKMACKRALVAAVLVTVNASEFFTQDMEDLIDVTPVTVINTEPIYPDLHAEIDDAAELSEARRTAEELGFGGDGDYGNVIDLDYMPDMLFVPPEPGRFGQLADEAVQHLGYKHRQHVENTIKQVIPDRDQRAELSYGSAWKILQDHQRSKVEDPV